MLTVFCAIVLGTSTLNLAEECARTNKYEEARAHYAKRAEEGGSQNEVFWALYGVAKMDEALKKPTNTVVKSYNRAYLEFPTRIEPLFRIANCYFNEQNYILCYLVADYAVGLALPIPKERVLVEKWIYEWGLKLLLADSSVMIGKIARARELTEELLTVKELPEPLRYKLNTNLERTK